MREPPVPTAQDTIAAILERAKRSALPLRRTFVQAGNGAARPPFAELVRHHDKRGLDLYLLIVTQASGGEYDVAHPADVWARALSWEGRSGVTLVSKTLARLVGRYRLVKRDRLGRLAHITLLCEDGSGRPYAHPFVAGDPYLQLPHAYWVEGWHKRLTLAGMAALLIARSFPRDFFLQIEHAPKQFGISADTLGDGERELIRCGLLKKRVIYHKAPLSRIGYTTESRYRLQKPFEQRPHRAAGVEAGPDGPQSP